MKITFLFQGEEVYCFELPPQTEKAVFEFVPANVYCKFDIPIPVITEIEFRPEST